MELVLYTEAKTHILSPCSPKIEDLLSSQTQVQVSAPCLGVFGDLRVQPTHMNFYC